MIDNEIQYKSAVKRFNYLDNLEIIMDISDLSEWSELLGDIYTYEAHIYMSKYSNEAKNTKSDT